MKWLAFDIGGVKIKAADGDGYVASHNFPLWQTPEHLSETLRAMIAQAPRADHMAATMTGELADCFTTKAEGVQYILDALIRAADGRHARIYLTNGRLVAPPIALRQPLLAAASNWHALASFAGRYARTGPALLIDIGSTTTDIIPLRSGAPCASGATDPERLASGELVYTGVERSPLCALLREASWRGQMLPVAQELFATTFDVYLTLGDLPEEPHSSQTADRRPATAAAACSRLARMVCADGTMFDENDAHALAASAGAAQRTLVAAALAKVLGRMAEPPAVAIVSGRGEFLARSVLEELIPGARLVSLGAELGSEVSRCVTAHALAVLAREGPRAA